MRPKSPRAPLGLLYALHTRLRTSRTIKAKRGRGSMRRNMFGVYLSVREKEIENNIPYFHSILPTGCLSLFLLWLEGPSSVLASYIRPIIMYPVLKCKCKSYSPPNH